MVRQMGEGVGHNWRVQGTSLRALGMGLTGEPLLGDSELKTSAES